MQDILIHRLMIYNCFVFVFLYFQFNTAGAECGRPYIQDFVDFVADLHVLNKIKV